MTKISTDLEYARIPSYDEIVAFEPDEFATALQSAMSAASGEAHIQDPGSIHIVVPDQDGEPVHHRLADTPETRMIMAMQQRYGQAQPLKYHSAALRIWALMDLINAGGLEPRITRQPGKPGRYSIPDSVVAAGAVVPLDEWLQFPVLDFMRMVTQIEQGLADDRSGLAHLTS